MEMGIVYFKWVNWMVCELYINKVIIKTASIANILNIITKRKKKKTFVSAETPSASSANSTSTLSPFLKLLVLSQTTAFLTWAPWWAAAWLSCYIPRPSDPSHTRSKSELAPSYCSKSSNGPRILGMESTDQALQALSSTTTLSLPERPSHPGLPASPQAHQTHSCATCCSVQDHGSTISFLSLRFQMKRHLFREPSPSPSTKPKVTWENLTTPEGRGPPNLHPPCSSWPTYSRLLVPKQKRHKSWNPVWLTHRCLLGL